MKNTLIILATFIYSISYSQTITVGIFEKGYPVSTKVKDAYEKKYGVGNVTINNYGDVYSTPYNLIKTNDVLVVNVFYQTSLPQILADNIVQSYKDNIHLVLSTEGSELATGERISSFVWNKITGQSITETPGNASGTADPPRFHPSNGPGGLSTNNNLTGSSTTYASFGNLNPVNVLHQRELTKSNCSNVEGLDALFPHLPKVGKPTIYINGEIYYPFFNRDRNPEVKDLSDNIVNLHHALLTNDSKTLSKINDWVNDPNNTTSFSLEKKDLVYEMPNVFTPNNDFNNDIFKVVKKSNKVEKVNFVVMNRWGNQVFKTADLGINWDGKSTDNKRLNEGTYYYYVQVTFTNKCLLYPEEKTIELKGNLTLVR